MLILHVSMQAEITELLAAIKSEEQEVQALRHQVNFSFGIYIGCHAGTLILFTRIKRSHLRG